jgi:hypothetical protein
MLSYCQTKKQYGDIMENIVDLKDLIRMHLGTGIPKTNRISETIFCMIKSGTVSLSKISVNFNGEAKNESKRKALHRLIKDLNIDRDRISRLLFEMFPGRKSKVAIIIDRTSWKFGGININIFMLSLSYKNMAFPIMWSILENKGGSSSSDDRIDLIQRFINLFGSKRIGCILGDREFASVSFIEYLIKLDVNFRLRIKGNVKTNKKNGDETCVRNLFRSLKKGECIAFEEKRNILGHCLFISGKKLKDGKLLIVASRFKNKNAMNEYMKRWGIETMFRSFKSSGFRIEDTHLIHIERISNMLSIVAISFSFSYLVGIMKSKIEEIEIKSHGRKAKSLFRVGLDEISQINPWLSKNDKKYMRIMLALTRS